MAPTHTQAAGHERAPGGASVPDLATLLIHSDDVDHSAQPNHAVAQSIELSTTFRAPHPETELGAAMASGELMKSYDLQDPQLHIYSRYTTETRGRAEKVLSQATGGHAVTYGSGMAAVYAALMHYSPKVIAIRKGYHGVHEAIRVFRRAKSDLTVIDLDDEYPTIEPNRDGVQPVNGLLVWVETPLNPTGEARDLQKYSDRAHGAKGVVVVDSTFAPPPLQNPFKQGADMVMHSATKYFGGHSDLLVGVLVVTNRKEYDILHVDRCFLGSNPGNLEAYLLLRSLRTLDLRVRRQSETATQLVQWLHSLTATFDGQTLEDDVKLGITKGAVVNRVWHASLQPRKDKDPLPVARLEEGAGFDPKEQMPGGYSPTFAIRMAESKFAMHLPHVTEYFIPATSLGGHVRTPPDPTQAESGANGSPSAVRWHMTQKDLLVDPPSAMKHLLLADIIYIGALYLIGIAILIRRVLTRKCWIFRLVRVSSGLLVVPHLHNCWSLACVAFGSMSQVYHIMTFVDLHTRNPPRHICITLIYLWVFLFVGVSWNAWAAAVAKAQDLRISLKLGRLFHVQIQDEMILAAEQLAIAAALWTLFAAVVFLIYCYFAAGLIRLLFGHLKLSKHKNRTVPVTNIVTRSLGFPTTAHGQTRAVDDETMEILRSTIHDPGRDQVYEMPPSRTGSPRLYPLSPTMRLFTPGSAPSPRIGSPPPPSGARSPCPSRSESTRLSISQRSPDPSSADVLPPSTGSPRFSSDCRPEAPPTPVPAPARPLNSTNSAGRAVRYFAVQAASINLGTLLMLTVAAYITVTIVPETEKGRFAEVYFRSWILLNSTCIVFGTTTLCSIAQETFEEVVSNLVHPNE
ncbi:hypothetical protein OC845_002145 [Tilletia horrida]|nr:hypothetical protein OC845_002145 [Tilletia horrida]